MSAARGLVLWMSTSAKIASAYRTGERRLGSAVRSTLYAVDIESHILLLHSETGCGERRRDCDGLGCGLCDWEAVSRQWRRDGYGKGAACWETGCRERRRNGYGLRPGHEAERGQPGRNGDDLGNGHGGETDCRERGRNGDAFGSGRGRSETHCGEGLDGDTFGASRSPKTRRGERCLKGDGLGPRKTRCGERRLDGDRLGPRSAFRQGRRRVVASENSVHWTRGQQRIRT